MVLIICCGAFLLIAALGLTVRLGLIPVNADAAPSYLEKRMFPMILRASVARQSAKVTESRPLVKADRSAGREIYASMCSDCHGRLDGRAGMLGLSFYPQAPQFTEDPISYSDPETFWVVKHGIRNTGMPSWGGRLSEQDIWNVVAFVKALPSAETRDHAAPAQ